jgi:hypothetical protein
MRPSAARLDSVIPAADVCRAYGHYSILWSISKMLIFRGSAKP